MSQSASTSSQAAVDGLAAGGDALLGMATLGKTAAALALILAILLGGSLLLKRLGGVGQGQGHRPRVIGSTAVGSRERVVIVEVASTWLVLGVGGGQVNKLHDLPAPADAALASDPTPDNDGFASRFAKALRHDEGREQRQAGLGDGRDRERP